MKRLLCLLGILVLSFTASGRALALNPGDRVDNFRLLDHRGESHELYYLSDAKAVVLMVQGNGCPIVRNTLPGLKELREQYQRRGVEFLLINSNLQDGRDAIAKEAAEFGIDFPILVDDLQLIGESLGVTRTADVFVVDPKTWKLVYRGPMDDRLSYGAQKPTAKKHYSRMPLTRCSRANLWRLLRPKRPDAWSTCPSAIVAKRMRRFPTRPRWHHCWRSAAWRVIGRAASVRGQ